MSTTTTTTITSQTPSPTINASKGKNRMLLDGQPTHYGDFRDDLNRDGYAVIKGAIPLDRARNYADAFYTYMEDLYAPITPSYYPQPH